MVNNNTAPPTPPPTPPIQNQPVGPTTMEVGYVIAVNNYIIWLNGLPNIRLNEIIFNDNKARAIITAIKDDTVEALVLDDTKIHPQERFYKSDKQLSIKAGPHLLSRAINPLGTPIDGKSGFNNLGQEVEIDHPPPSIRDREKITNQFDTGVTIVDMLIPLAFGQRELIIGDNHSGKSGFLLDTVANQKDKNTICIYAMIGKPIDTIKNTIDALSLNKALPYTTIVATSSSERASLIYLTPLVATAVAEYFQKQGKNVLLILDDLGLHAKFYREISLLSGKPPGRDSYPGDIFYQHAKIVERCGKFSEKAGGGSITALPIIETISDDISSFMTTNLMGMTDGHLLFTSARYHQGIRPSIDISLSVSRVGRQTQNLAQKSLADKVKALLSESNRLQAYSRLGSEVSPQTLFTLKQGKQVESILKQGPSTDVNLTVQMILLGLVFTPFLKDKDQNYFEVNRESIVSFLSKSFDLKGYGTKTAKMKDADEFITSLNQITPLLEKITKGEQTKIESRQ